jgi:hypothetical protein
MRLCQLACLRFAVFAGAANALRQPRTRKLQLAKQIYETNTGQSVYGNAGSVRRMHFRTGIFWIASEYLER